MIKAGKIIEIQPETFCWPVEIVNSSIIGRLVSEGNPPKTGAFYWGWTIDRGVHKLEGRLIPREKIIGFSLGKTVTLEIDHFKWEKSWHGKHDLDLFYTDKHGIVAARANDVQAIQNPRHSQVFSS